MSLLDRGRGFLALARHKRFERRHLVGPKLLRAFADTYPEAFFIEIGANDGRQSDHLTKLVSSWAWRGIMVEPQADAFRRLSQLHGAEERIELENVAISTREGAATFWEVTPPAPGEDWELYGSYDLLGSFDREVLLSHEWIRDRAERITRTEVECIRYETLCRRHAVGEVDLLLVDTEGHDLEVVSQLEGDVPRPRLLIYEHALLSAADRERGAALVDRLGYERFEEHFDSWCLDTSVDDGLTERFRELLPRAYRSVALR